MLQGFEADVINMVNGAADQYHMLYIGALLQAVFNGFLQKMAVGKVQVFVDTDNQYGWAGAHLMTADITEMVAVADPADFGNMRFAGAFQKQYQRQQHTQQNAAFGTTQQYAGKGHQPHQTITFLITPGLPSLGKTD